ncbi:dyslexia-associated protein kiaa0319-like protein, partial [Plakobranchus ocellatus]
TKLTVSAGEQKTIQLPTNSITLTAFVLPEPDEGETYTYEWSPVTLPSNAEKATMDGKNTNKLKLSNLIAGLYVLKVKVTGDNKFGEALINVTVLPPARQNQPPHAIINPTTQEVNLPNSAILDGSDSTDDDKIVTWKWEEVSGPLKGHELDSEGQMLTLKDMAPGNYTFRLTVTDSDGATNSTSANVTINKEKDYPPRADAGSNQVVFLPKNSLDLFGNKSSDDKGEITYEWIKSADDKLTVGMTGVRSPVLHLTNLEAGDYKFTLKVTDSSGQTDTADVRVFVKPQTNKPPVASTAGQVHLFLPQESLTLDGTNSTDEQGKLTYLWVQSGGPTTLTLTNGDKAVAIATGTITEGEYEFQLTVTDSSGQHSSDKLTVTLKKDVKLPPKANAGGNKVVELPVSLVTLDGSKSSDDHGISKYLWERDSKSLAAGTVVNNSDHKAVLQLVNLVAGQYLFTLTVEDAEGLTSKDTASLVVNKNAHEKDSVELIIDANINHFTTANKESLKAQLELMLQKQSEDHEMVVHFLDTSEDILSGHLVLTFQVLKHDKESSEVVRGLQALNSLKAKLGSGKILDYSIIRLDLTVCQNNCSGHGHCDEKTKQCVCEAFWMPNFFASSAFGTETNCDWSVLYVVIISFIILVTTISTIWAIICCITSKKCKLKLKQKRRHRYSLLRDADKDGDKEGMEMMTKGKIQNSSVMISESELSSDEETLFISSSNKRLPNGINGKALANGSKASGYRSKLKT